MTENTQNPMPTPTPENGNNRWDALKNFLRLKFNLAEDNASQEEVTQNISKSVEFQGTNLWILIFATMVASIGLNVNSTAVIIGAMLISPLMGPIMGLGLALGTNDFQLVKRSLKNFGFMVLVAILTSTLYFCISPLSNAQSELLARTTPTTWDVLIALFGGLAGIVAQSRKDRTSTVIPGVAIATALMPPLCTAGFGIATGQFSYFIGAIYLFFINTVFIALATFIIVRFLDYEKKTILDPRRERTVKHYMSLLAFITIAPSVLLGFRIVKQTIFEANADKFVASVIKFDKAQILKYDKTFSTSEPRIDVVLIGESVSEDAIANITAQLPQYGLKDVALNIRHANPQQEEMSMSLLQTNMEELLKDKNARIKRLEERLATYTRDAIPTSDISKEMSALIPKRVNTALSKTVVHNSAGEPTDTVLVCLIKTEPDVQLSGRDREQIGEWLKVRTKCNKIKLIVEE